MNEDLKADGAAGRAPSFAIITPSYRPHFEHCRLLAESVLRHVPEPVHHYILVDKDDEGLFSVLRSSRTHLVLKQDILPWWLIQIPFARSWWANLRGLPVRGWILQQLAKLSVNLGVPADVYVYLDSGAFFVADYDPRVRVRNREVPLYREQTENMTRVPWNTRWHQVSAKLLGLPVQPKYTTGYIANLVTWTRENLGKLQSHVEKVTGRHWVASVSRELRFSEYVLYGMFVEHVLKECSGQYLSAADPCLNHWSTRYLDDAGLRDFKKNLGSDVVLVMINEKAGIPPSAIRRVFLED